MKFSQIKIAIFLLIEKTPMYFRIQNKKKFFILKIKKNLFFIFFSQINSTGGVKNNNYVPGIKMIDEKFSNYKKNLNDYCS